MTVLQAENGDPVVVGVVQAALAHHSLVKLRQLETAMYFMERRSDQTNKNKMEI